MISAEYGWSDKRILNLTLARFNQIRTAIVYRQFMVERSRRRLWSWHARTLASWIASTIQVDPKELDQPMSELARLSVFLDADEKAELDWASGLGKPAESESSGWKPGDPAIVREPPRGSAEALMGLMHGVV